MSSRKPPLIGAGLRITPSVKLARCDVTSGRNAKRFQICQYSRPAAFFVTLIRSAYGLGCGIGFYFARKVGWGLLNCVFKRLTPVSAAKNGFGCREESKRRHRCDSMQATPACSRATIMVMTESMERTRGVRAGDIVDVTQQ